MNRVIEFIVTADGHANVETKGFAGSGCRQASEFIEKARGKRLSEQTTPEFYPASQKNQMELKNRFAEYVLPTDLQS